MHLLALGVLQFAVLMADGPKDNDPARVRPIPPPGISMDGTARQLLERRLEEVRRAADVVFGPPTAKEPRSSLRNDIQVLIEGVERTQATNMFYKPAEIQAAHRLLDLAATRLNEARQGRPSWRSAKGPVVRGYRSQIDGSIQPYGLVVPDSFDHKAPVRHRLDIWFHGRGETLSEVNFMTQRLTAMGEFAPRDAFVLHPYGRYNNANRFAGEVDAFEALEDVARSCSIDLDRIAVRGFSMGGAACWQFATHHPSRWVAAAPGAGFSETAEFLKHFQQETLRPEWWEQKLWRLYDCTTMAGNLATCPTVAYSGEFDIQRQAADIMATSLKREGIELVHVIGPKTGHRYEPAAKEEVARRIDSIVARGRSKQVDRIKFTTFTLRYANAGWLQLDALERHWEEASIEAERAGDRFDFHTKNVVGFSVQFEPGQCPIDIGRSVTVVVDGAPVGVSNVPSDRSWKSSFWRGKEGWRQANDADQSSMRKRPGLQGPIDDAFMDAFVFVRPTRPSMHVATGAWVDAELQRAERQWILQFRGKARTIRDVDVSEEVIQNSHLVLWGDPKSNVVLARIIDRLPFEWTPQRLQLAGKSVSAAGHMPILVFPNPLNLKRYVVLNSGFTFREYDHLNNARQTPKLPDFALVDLSLPPSFRWPGKVVHAGFFDEQWRPPHARP